MDLTIQESLTEQFGSLKIAMNTGVSKQENGWDLGMETATTISTSIIWLGLSILLMVY